MNPQITRIPVLLPVTAFRLFAPENLVGGQAIIEGVMMRGSRRAGWAVRKPDGTHEIESFDYIPVAERAAWLGFPVIRGAVTLFESLKLGMKALSRSAEIAGDLPAGGQSLKESIISIFSMVLAITAAVGLFMFLPMWLLSLAVGRDSAVLFNIGAGVLRILFFLAYLCAISAWKEIRRIFEYHGAEHRAIFAFEDGLDCTVENMDAYSTRHPRCGTSFIILVGLACILLFSVLDTIYGIAVGPYPSVVVRFSVHLAVIPLVSGISYEALRFSFTHRTNPCIRFLIQPGLALQYVTTRVPDRGQMETAACALKAVL